MPSCQPVRVQWDAPKVDEPWRCWQLSIWCNGCGKGRQLVVAGFIAENVEMAEKTEQIQLAALHAPDLPF